MGISDIAGRKTFFGISSFQALAMFRRGMFYSYLSIYLRFYLGLTVTETTFFASFPMICNILFQNFVWGRISDKYQKRRTLIIVGEISAAISTVLVWYVHILPGSHHTSGYVIILGMSFVEIFWSMSNVGWSALLSDLYPADARAGLQGRLQSVGAMGRFIGVWVGGLLYDGLPIIYEGWGFRSGTLFFIASAAMLLSTIPMLFLPEGGAGDSSPNRTTGNPILAFFGIDYSDPASKRFLVFLLAMFFIFFGLNMVVLLVAQYLTLDTGFDISSRTLSYVINTATAAIFIVGLFIGKLSRRIPDEYLLLVGAGTGIIYEIGFALANSLPVIFVMYFLAGTAQSIIMASSYSYAARLIPPEKRGKQFAMFNAAMFLSWGLPGTFIAGPLVDRLISLGYSQVFSYRMAFVAGALLILFGVIVLRFDIRRNNRSELDAAV
jgi:MFS family permease